MKVEHFGRQIRKNPISRSHRSNMTNRIYCIYPANNMETKLATLCYCSEVSSCLKNKQILANPCVVLKWAQNPTRVC